MRPCGRVGTPDKLRGDVWEEDVEGGKHELLAWGEPSHRLNSPMEMPRGAVRGAGMNPGEGGAGKWQRCWLEHTRQNKNAKDRPSWRCPPLNIRDKRRKPGA